MVLVDSSVWVAAAKPSNPECLKLKRLIEKNEVVVTKVIQVEVSQGARTKGQFQEIWHAFEGFDFLEVQERNWLNSAQNYFRCRKKGITLSTIDCLIGTLCSDYNVELWSLDKNLKASHKVIGFDLITARQ